MELLPIHPGAFRTFSNISNEVFLLQKVFVVSSVKQTVLAQFFTRKGYPQTPKTFTHTPKHSPDLPFILKLITFIITLKKYTYKSENTLTTPFNTKKIITFIITLKSIPAKLTRFRNIHISPFHTKNNSKRNNMYKITITH